MSIQGDGGGSAGTSCVVEADGTGTFEDEAGELRVRVDGAGSGTYDDGTTEVRIEGGEAVEVDDDEGPVPAITAVLADGLPLFPSVPRVGPVPAPDTGESCGTVVRLDAAVLFDFDRSEVRPEGADLLGRVARLLAALGYPAVQVNGHTDGVGDPTDNVELSEQRASAVATVLEVAGVPPPSLTVTGRESHCPSRRRSRPRVPTTRPPASSTAGSSWSCPTLDPAHATSGPLGPGPNEVEDVGGVGALGSQARLGGRDPA